MANVGYARVSSSGQSLEVQLKKLSFCDEIFQEKISGKRAARPQLDQCLRFVRRGDTLHITKIDRLARSSTDLFNIAKQLEEKGVDLAVIDQNIDTTTPTGKLLFQVLAIIAEFENTIRHERQMEGIKQAKERGVKIGRTLSLTTEDDEEIYRLRHKEKMTVPDIAQKYGVSIRTIYRSFDRVEGKLAWHNENR
ncbi:MAG: recombinase family protein [Chloroflexota bacterium]